MRHKKKLIETYWFDPDNLSKEDADWLSEHLEECAECRRLMASYEYAMSVVDEVIGELERDPTSGNNGVDELLKELI